ncbi:zinc transporter ZntB [Pseudomonas sp. N040]|uniref:zinc transporter ZntB n=1 Tax=Pseudomonas sp. N040 TaxID=2785325 RepID=UPI0018A25DE5|nr:zinc transporter ZntB [Pseudomonas sp. N040]MBF7730772.1 zinc transporter ZntB [Pseudomonas sp. N040]MBW7014415.1 zinc transporter ZntB [Pseudomonas sp. N040]
MDFSSEHADVGEWGLIEALVLDGHGSARRTTRADLDSLQLGEQETLWLHLDRSHPQAQRWLRERSGLSAFACDLLLEEGTRPRVVQPDAQQLLVFLRGVNLNPDAEPEDMVSLRIFVEQNRVISLRMRHLRARAELTGELAAGKGPATAQGLVLRLADLMTDKIDPLVAELAELVDSEDEQIELNEGYSPDHTKMVTAKRRSASLRRFLAPQRDIFFELAKDKFAWFVGEQAKDWNELGNSLTRHLEELELIRERVGLVLESEHQRMGQRMNRVMYLFAIVTGFFLPLTFLTGLLGINVAGIPGSDYPHAFKIVCLAMLGIGLLQWWLFRRLRLMV